MSEPKRKLKFMRAVSEMKPEKPGKSLHRVQSMQVGNLKPLQRSKRWQTVSGIEELIQCGICLNKLTQPKMLPCQHTFCLDCLKSHFNASNTGLFIDCPFCKIKVTLQEGLASLEKLPPNLYIDNLLRLVTDTPPNSPVSVAPEKRCAKCQAVSNLQESFCQHCVQTFCKICFVEHLSEMESKLPMLLKQLEESETKLEHKMDNYETRCKSLKEMIKSSTEEKIKKIRSLEKEALEKVDSIKKNNKIEFEDIMKQLESFKEDVKGIKLSAVENDVNKVSIIMNIHDNFSKILDDLVHWGEARVIFDPETFALDLETEGFCNDGDEGEIVNGVRTTQNPLESIDAMATHYKSRNFKAKLLWTKCPRPSGVGIPPWDSNNLYIAATDSHVVLILNKKEMKLIGRLTSPDMLCPMGLAFSDKTKEIFVVDKWKHCIHVYSSHGDYLRMLCSKGYGDGRIRSPEDVALTQNGQLIVCDTGNDRVVILDPENGKQIATIGINSDNITELNMPTSVTVYNDHIIIADSGNHQIKIYNIKGEKVLEFGSMGRNRGQFRSPEVVAVDPLGFIIVGDSGNARLQFFKPDGTLVRIFGNSSNSSEAFRWISGITVTPQLEIIVTDCKKRSLQIF